MSDRLPLEDQNKISTAVETTLQKALNGDNPSESLASVATGLKLTPNQVKRACEAFNVTRTLHHFKNTQGTNKTASFPIADPKAVIDAMYPSTQGVRESFEVKEAAYTIDDMFDNELTGLDLVVNSEVPKYTDELVCQKVASAINRARGYNDKVQSELATAFVDVEDTLYKIAEVVKYVHGDSIADIQDEHIAAAVLPHVSKAASVKPATGRQSPELAELLKEAAARINYAGCLNDFADVIAEDKEELCKLAANPADHLSMGTAALPLIGGKPWTDAFLMKGITEATQSQKAMKQIAENFRYDPTADPQFNDFVKDYRALKTSVGLNNLMKTDEVLSHAEPQKVLNAYNSIATHLPNISESPEMLTSMLRYATEYGTLDIPTLTGLMKQDTLMSGQEEILGKLRDDIKSKSTAGKEHYTKVRADNKQDKDKKKELKEKKRKDDLEAAKPGSPTRAQLAARVLKMNSELSQYAPHSPEYKALSGRILTMRKKMDLM